MVKLTAKALSQVMAAIRNLRESKGSTSKEILRYISAVCNLPSDVVKREMQAALKRGVTYGILMKNGARYVLPKGPAAESEAIINQELGLLNIRCIKTRRKQRRSSSRRSEGRKSSSGCTCKTKRRRRRKRSRRRSSRRRSRRSSGCICNRRKRSRRRRRRKSRKCVCGKTGSQRSEGIDNTKVKSENYKKEHSAKCVYFADEDRSDLSDNEKS
ncbi:probable ATP-dependent RNA helicase DDX46 [Prorops nasuta]|uniref:probable ATP-dependent RNA helicase DDX46 n=1 Tax=Prorops nasuta TaxID=863751 RepID=UPI0034CD850E